MGYESRWVSSCWASPRRSLSFWFSSLSSPHCWPPQSWPSLLRLPFPLPFHLLSTRQLLAASIWCIYLTYLFFYLGDGELNGVWDEFCVLLTISLIFSSRYSSWSSLRYRHGSVPRPRGVDSIEDGKSTTSGRLPNILFIIVVFWNDYSATR